MKALLLALFSISLFAQESNLEQTRNLWDAIENIEISKTKTAIERGADVNSVNPDDRVAVTNMISRCINSSSALSDMSLKTDLVNICRMIINAESFNLEQKRPITRRTPLQVASAAGALPIVQLLTGLGANVNLGARRSPIQLAARNGHVDVVKHLLSVDRLDINEGGRECALAKAVKHEDSKVFQIIVDSEKANKLNKACLKSSLDYAKRSEQYEMSGVLEALKPQS